MLLFFGAFGLGCFIALLDPYLHIWDESYHALVAKNLMDNPFYPVLYKIPVLNYDYTLWTDNYIWLHKQPLFLWQIALSMKIFGINEFSVRLPSVIMHAIIPIFIYRIGKISLNNKIGFYGALFFSLSYFPLELISGVYFTDHNDIAFLFYVTASFWAWFEYTYTKKSFWLILIGLFAGCAVLIKWLMGLLVFICWAFTFFSERQKMLQWRTYTPFIKSVLISMFVFIPWQIYILCRFPVESKYEFPIISSRLFKVLDGHGGNFWYHFEATRILYGSGLLVSFLLIFSLVVLFKKLNSINYRIFIISAILFVYLLYSIAATKSLAYCIIVSPLIYLGFSALFITAINYFEKKHFKNIVKNSFFYVLLSLICFFIIDMKDIQINHTMYKPSENEDRIKKLAEKSLINNLDNILPDKKYIIFNTNFAQGGNIPFMFYTDYIAYRCIPSKEQCEEVIRKGYKIAILDFNNLPDYIIYDENIIKIPITQ
ncbi:MAG: glycosyltransferase family 39 protein [Bacteroidales bacterium]